MALLSETECCFSEYTQMQPTAITQGVLHVRADGSTPPPLPHIYTQNYWVSGLCLSSGIINNRKHDVSETGSLSVLR
jgi:hypothetical protein